VYEVDSRDTVVSLRGAPQPDVGAPLPMVLCDEHRLLLGYLISEPDPAWDGSYVTMVSAESEGLALACVRFKWPAAHMFGPRRRRASDELVTLITPRGESANPAGLREESQTIVAGWCREF